MNREIKIRLKNIKSIFSGYLGGHFRGIEDGHGLNLGCFLPIFVQNQQKFLCSAQCKDRNQATASAGDDTVDRVRKPRLPYFPLK